MLVAVLALQFGGKAFDVQRLIGQVVELHMNSNQYVALLLSGNHLLDRPRSRGFGAEDERHEPDNDDHSRQANKNRNYGRQGPSGAIHFLGHRKMADSTVLRGPRLSRRWRGR